MSSKVCMDMGIGIPIYKMTSMYNSKIRMSSSRKEPMPNKNKIKIWKIQMAVYNNKTIILKAKMSNQDKQQDSKKMSHHKILSKWETRVCQNNSNIEF